jgi:hypothetical protein
VCVREREKVGREGGRVAERNNASKRAIGGARWGRRVFAYINKLTKSVPTKLFSLFSLSPSPPASAPVLG